LTGGWRNGKRNILELTRNMKEEKTRLTIRLWFKAASYADIGAAFLVCGGNRSEI